MARPFRLLASICFAATLCFAPAMGSAAEPAATTDPRLRDSLTKLLNDTWEKSAEGMLNAEQHHREAKSAAAGDPRVDFALTLVQLRYLRFSDAEKSLTTLTAASPDYWPATQAKIHLAILMKKNSQALSAIDAFSRRVADAPETTERTESRREAADFLGSMFGYLEGPAAKSISQATVAEVRGKVLSRFDDAQRKSFAAAFDSVTDRFAQLNEDTQRSKTEGIATQKEQKEIDLKRLQAEQAALAGEKENNRRIAKDAFEEAQGNIGKIDQQLPPLEAAFARANARAQLVRAEILQLDANIVALIGEADVTKDSALRVALRARADLLTLQLRNEQFALRNIEAEGAQIAGQRDALLSQRGAIVERYQGEMRRLGIEGAKLGRSEKRNVVQQKEAVKAPSGFTPQVQTKAAATASITSYVEFPLEREKSRILDSLR